MSAKRKRRRQAFDDMKSERSRGTSNSTTTRHPLTSDQITSFLQAIRTKQKASFGLVKLRQLQLNSLITIPWLSDHNDGRRCQMTLLEYAAFRGRGERWVTLVLLIRTGSAFVFGLRIIATQRRHIFPHRN